MHSDLREAIARKLYEQWCDNFGDPFEPDWPAYEAGASLNGGSLTASRFRGGAETIAPFDTPEAVARRMCRENHIPECSGCTEPTCIGWKDWLPYAEQVVALAEKATA